MFCLYEEEVQLGGDLLALALGGRLGTALLRAGRLHVLPQLGLPDALLAVQGSVDGGETLQLLERHGDHAVAATLGQSQLESVEVGQISTLQGDGDRGDAI